MSTVRLVVRRRKIETDGMRCQRELCGRTARPSPCSKCRGWVSIVLQGRNFSHAGGSFMSPRAEAESVRVASALLNYPVIPVIDSQRLGRVTCTLPQLRAPTMCVGSDDRCRTRQRLLGASLVEVSLMDPVLVITWCSCRPRWVAIRFGTLFLQSNRQHLTRLRVMTSPSSLAAEYAWVKAVLSGPKHPCVADWAPSCYARHWPNT